MARAVEVALVVVELPVTTRLPLMVEEAEERNPASVGLMEKTRAPVPVSSPSNPARSADVCSEVEDSLALNVVQSVVERSPLFAPDAVGRFHVSVEPEPVTEKSVPVVEEAIITAGPVVVCPVGPIEVSAAVR